MDYVELIFDEFVELHGDRAFGDDRAIRTGFARLGDYKVHAHRPSEGADARRSGSECFYGCAHPEGYRKALAKMKLAAKFRLPVVCLIDTPGAYPGHRRGGARPGAADRDEHPGDVAAADADRLRGDRGGRVRRGAGHRRRRPGEHARARLLLGHQSRRVCAASSGRSATDETKPRAAEALRLTATDLLRARGHRRRHPGAARRRPPRAARDGEHAEDLPGRDTSASCSRPTARSTPATSGTRSSGAWAYLELSSADGCVAESAHADRAAISHSYRN